jgi:hypothetical protein
MMGSKQVDHWTSGTVNECTENAGSSQGPPPQQPTMSVVKPEGGPAASAKSGKESCVRLIGIITLSARWPRDGSGQRPPQARPQSHRGHQSSETMLTGESRFTYVLPWGLNPGPS